MYIIANNLIYQGNKKKLRMNIYVLANDKCDN